MTINSVTLLTIAAATFFLQCVTRAQVQEPIHVIDPVTGNETIYSDPLAPSFSVDLKRGCATFPTNDGSNEEFLSIDMYHNGISELLFDKELQFYMDIVPSQIDEILRNRDDAIKKFAYTIDGIVSSEDIRFKSVRQNVEELSKQMIEKCESVLLPHQKELRQSYQRHIVIWAEGGALNSLLEGTLRKSLDDDSVKSIDAKKAEIAERVRKEIIELHNRAIQDLLAEIPPEKKATIESKLSSPPRFIPFSFHNQHKKDCWNSIGLPSFEKLLFPTRSLGHNQGSPCSGCD